MSIMRGIFSPFPFAFPLVGGSLSTFRTMKRKQAFLFRNPILGYLPLSASGPVELIVMRRRYRTYVASRSMGLRESAPPPKRRRRVARDVRKVRALCCQRRRYDRIGLHGALKLDTRSCRPGNYRIGFPDPMASLHSCGGLGR